MKKIIVTLASVLAYTSVFAGNQFGEKMSAIKAKAEIITFSNFDFDTENLPKGFTQIKTGKAGKGLEFTAVADKWQTAKFSGTAKRKGSVRFMFRSKLGERNILYFDNLKINGKLVPNGDFSSGTIDGWSVSKEHKNPEVVYSPIPNGRGMSFPSKRGVFIVREIQVEKGEKIEIALDCLCSEKLGKDYSLDFSNAYNVVLGGNDSFVKNVKAPKTPRIYGGMKFNLLDNNSAPNIVYLKHNENVLVEYKNASVEGKYLYLLYTADKLKVKGEKTGGVVIRVVFRDGRRISRYIKLGTDLQAFTNKVESLANTKPVYVDNKEKNTGGVYITRVDLVGGGVTSPIKSIELDSRLDFQILGATLSSEEVFTTEVMQYAPDKWVELDTSDMEVKEGTALDVSYLVSNHAPAGKFGRVVVGKNGTFEFEKRPNEPIRFKGTNFYSLTCQIGKRIKTKEQIDEYVKMLKKQGFNALRWRFSVENNIFDKENGIKKEYWDLYDYFLYALGKEGIYSYFYLASHDVGAPNFKWNERTAVKMRMILGYPEVRQAWRKYAKMQLNHVNPYTKLAWKDDPSIATLEYWNEFDLGFNWSAIDSKALKIFTKRFQDFLEKRYKTIDAFLAYSKEIDQKWITKKTIKSFKDITFDNPHANRYHPDLGRFAIELVRDMQNFCRKVVFEEVGMKVATFQHNCVKNLFWTRLSTEIGSTTAINTYHDIATGFGVGAKSQQTSSIHDSANYWRGALSRNVVGMPMTVTEYQHCYPNQYCHELSLMFPTYSAFQDFAGLMEFDSPVAKTADVMGFKRIGVNPVLRVNDFLTNFFYLRGDVQPSKNRVDIVFDEDFFQKTKFASGALHQDQSKIALLTGLRLSFPEVKRVPELDIVKVAKPTISYKPMGVSKLTASFHATGLAGVWESTFSWDKVMADLKAKGILSADNRTDPKNEIYETDNKQIYMDSKNRLLQVNTPKSVGTTVNPDSKDLQVGVLTVKSANVCGAVALVSLDNIALENSKNLILTFATDSVLKHEKYSHSRKQLLEFGKPPVLIETGKIEVEVKTNGKNFVVYPLKINGERMEKIPSQLENGILKFVADNRKTPALYFEIVAE